MKKIVQHNIKKAYNTVKPHILLHLMENTFRMNEDTSGSLKSYPMRHKMETCISHMQINENPSL